MVQHPTEFTQQTTERAMLAASVSMNLLRQIAEQNIKQSRQSVEELGKVTRRMVDDFGNQASAICENSLSLAEGAKATVQFALPAAVDEFVGADEAGDDVVMHGWAFAIS